MNLPIRCFLGLGSNIGDRYGMLVKGLNSLATHYSPVAVASVYETEPWGNTNQSSFLNTTCVVDVDTNPIGLLQTIKQIESDLGRTPSDRWGPRLIDIDILTFGNQTVDEPRLQIPHSLIAQRLFVCAPLSEIAPDLKIPGILGTPTHLAANLSCTDTVNLWRKRSAVEKMLDHPGWKSSQH